MVVDVGIVGVQLQGGAEVREAELGVLARVLALLDEEGGALDQGVHTNLHCNYAHFAKDNHPLKMVIKWKQMTYPRPCRPL